MADSRARRRQGGFSLLETVIALGVISISLTGVLGLLLLTHRHNTSTSETAVAYKACQEMMEKLRTLSYDQVKAQNGVTFVAVKLHPTAPLGAIAVSDVSVPGDPDTLIRVDVSIVTQPGQVTLRPVNARLISWRTKK